MTGDAELFPGRVAPVPDGDDEDPPRPLGPADLDRLWLLDFHFPLGLTPLGLTTFAPAYAAGTRAGARAVGSPGSDGFSLRVDGPHVYVAPRRPEPAEAARRAEQFEVRWRRQLVEFPARWAAEAAALDAEAAVLLAPRPDAAADQTQAVADRLDTAVAHEARAWRIHFEEMYVLLAGHLAYRQGMAEQGVPPAIADACLAGFPSRPARADAALLDLAGDLRQAGVTDRATLEAHPHLAERFARLLAEHGQRTDGIADVGLASWVEAPGAVLERLVALAGRQPGGLHRGPDREARRQQARAEARARATDAATVDALVAEAETTNWIWWNEEHNGVIDLRASLPLRRAALDAGRLLFDDPDAGVLCGLDELRAALRGTARPPGAALLAERQAWLAEHRARRPRLPETVGRPGDAVDDPVLAEVFGLGLGLAADGRSITGMGASRGRARGPARVVRSAAELDRVEPGDVLVCEATSPSWGFAFALAAAVVCDKGGRTTHAAICAREYELPCVVSATGATRVVREGQLVEVDGDAGVVRLLEAP